MFRALRETVRGLPEMFRVLPEIFPKIGKVGLGPLSKSNTYKIDL